jgi:signal transduction histidine kinase
LTDPTPECAHDCVLELLGIPAAEREAIARSGSAAERRAAIERAVARRALDDRIAAVSSLASGLAHELNNPLAYVLSNLAFLAERTTRIAAIAGGADRALADQVAEAMVEARTGAERMRAILRDLRMLSHLDQDTRRPVDLVPVVDSCLHVAWSDLTSRAEVARDLVPVPRVLGDEAQLAQLVLNLLQNAAQAIPTGQPGGHVIRVATGRAADGRIALEVVDTGRGIAPEVLPRIFDPFFSTKGPGWGSGLGLSICHVVATSMGGEIRVESDVGRGSTFRVLLPPAPGGAPTTPTPVP